MILKVNNLFKRFADFVAGNYISFSLEKGEVFGFLGHNGAGKTTTIHMLLGILTPTSGSISYFGADFLNNQQAALQKIGYASGYDKMPGRLTVFENLDIAGRMYGISKKNRIDKIYLLLEAFGMTDIINKQCSGLSAGQSTCALLAKAFIADPDLVLLDEPTASLDPETAYRVRQFIIKKNKDDNTSVLITSHNMTEVTDLCNRVIILNKGNIIANDCPKKLASSINKVYIDLIFNEIANMFSCIDYFKNENIFYTIRNSKVTVAIDNTSVYDFLSTLFQKKIIYQDIIINRPTFEDYFLSCLRKEK